MRAADSSLNGSTLVNRPSLLLVPILAFFFTICKADTIEITNRTLVTSDLEAQILIKGNFERNQSDMGKRIDFDKIYIDNGNGEKIYSSQVMYVKKQMRIYFHISSNNFVVFEKLVSDSVGYFLNNTEDIQVGDSLINVGELQNITRNNIGKIKKDSWNEYVLNAYSANYLFPSTFDFGTELGLNDSAKTAYYLHIVHSGGWGKNIPMFWGVKARWSTSDSDKANFMQIYPLTILLIKSPLSKISLGTGIESGYLGVAKEGRATIKTDAQFRLPFNPVDLTLGFPRVRVNPIITISAQYDNNWSDTNTSASYSQGYDVNAGLHYGIPISDKYYLQADSKLNFASQTQKVHYQYSLTFGYIANGTVRVAASYQQGYQEVSYVFDRKLLLGFAFDVLNKETAR